MVDSLGLIELLIPRSLITWPEVNIRLGSRNSTVNFILKEQVRTMQALILAVDLDDSKSVGIHW